MKLSVALCTVCLMSMILMPVTHGAIIYFEQNASPSAWFNLNSVRVGAGFQTTSSDFVLSEISLSLNNADGATGDIDVSIYNADGTNSRPLTLVTVLATIDVSTLANDYTLKQVWSGNYTLTPSTNYYVVAAKTGTYSGEVRWALDTTPTFTYPSLGYVTGDATNFSSPNASFALGASVSAVPEPSTLATITAGFVSLTVGGYVRRRRRT